MEIVDIIRSAAWYIGVLNMVDAYLQDDDEDGYLVAQDLLRAFNNVENQLALEYLPLTEKEGFYTETGEVLYEEFSFKVVRIINVYNAQGEKQPFTLMPTYLQTAKGDLTIEYTYTPYEKDIYDQTDHCLCVAQPLYVFGVLAEYYLAKGAFEEAAVWDKKYKDAISASYQMQKGKRIVGRGWL